MHGARALLELHASTFHLYMIPINYGISTQTQFPIVNVKRETSGSSLRRLSISFSQQIIWFEVGMLWDAT